MACYEGENLAQKLRRGSLSPREALNLAVQIASGLAAAHARNIVHRDIKPSNILITSERVPKIVDFGLARVVSTPSATQQSLGLSGTIPYMSPEQTLGEPVDQRTDVWALGVVLVEMLTGTHPFSRDNMAAVTFAILNQAPAGVDATPALLQPILYRALSKNPAHRYPSAREMLADLESARAQLTASADSAVPVDGALTQAPSSRELKQYVERASTPRWARAPSTKPRWILGFSLAVVLLATASLLFAPVRERIGGLLYGGSEKHIAVLPFDNIGNNPTNDAVAEGLMDSLTSKLSNLDATQQSLWVVPASVVRSRKVTDPSTAYRELGATMVVKGSIQRQGADIHLTVNLIDTKRLRQIGSAALEDRAGDLATLQDEAVSRLARLMHIAVTPEMLRTTGGSVTPAALRVLPQSPRVHSALRQTGQSRSRHFRTRKRSADRSAVRPWLCRTR